MCYAQTSLFSSGREAYIAFNQVALGEAYQSCLESLSRSSSLVGRKVFGRQTADFGPLDSLFPAVYRC